MTSTVASTHSSVSGGNKSSSSSVIIIRSESNVVTTHEDEDSNPFGHEDPDSSILRCHISSLSHHPHLSLTSHAVKKDVNLSSTSCVEVNKRMNGQHNPCNLLSTGHTSSSHSSQSNQGMLRPSSASSLLHPVLDRYCESPSFLLDTSSSPTPHLSLSGHHSHHHLVGASDDDVDVDETSNDVSGRVSRMSSETPDPELMFSCSTLGSVDPRDVSVVTPSMMVDSVMGDDVGDSGIPTTSSILTHSSSSMKYTLNGHHREKILLNGHHNHQTTLSSLNRTVVDELDGDEDVVGDLSLSIKQEKLDGDVNCILKHPPLNHLKPSPVSSSLVISSTPVSLGGIKSHSRTATIHSPLILSQLNSNTTRLPNGTFISHQNHQQPVSKAIPDSSTSSLAGITMTSASTTVGTTNGHQVSSTTGSQSKQVVISAAPSVVHHVLTTSSTEGVTPVVASTLPSTISLTTSTSSSAVASTPLDIKILPAGILQLASNLAAVFPSTATATGNAVQKQQIAIQLLREDGTSIILPITTRGALAVSPITATTVTQGVQRTQANTTSVTTSVATGNTRLIQGMTAKSNTIVSAAGASKGKKSSSGGQGNNISNNNNQSGQQQEANDSNDRPFKCEICNSTFTRLGNYTRHKKIHSLPTKEDQRFRCEICSKSFIQRCDLARHLHIHRGTEPHRCPQCGKGYIRHSDLVTHQRFHNKEKPFACPHCSKGFCQRGDLNRHLRSIHLQLKPILCTHCHKKFAKEETLLRHINSTHRDKLLDN